MIFFGWAFAFACVLMLLLLVALLVLLERKVLGLAQMRKGPNIVGIYGIIQTVVDGVKLLLKEMVFVSGERFFFFFVSPVLGFVLALVSWFFFPEISGGDSSGGSVLFILAISSLLVYTVLWAGWGSGSVYSVVGGIRAVAQMVSYEVVLGLILLVLLYFLGSFGLVGFGFYFDHGLTLVYVALLGLVLWWGVVLAELNRVPFDLVEGESELVGGYSVEYSGYGFTLFFLSEYLNIWAMSYLSALVFFSWHCLWLVFLGVVFIVYVRGLLPRYKFTDLIMLTWRIYLPSVFLGILLFLVTVGGAPQT
uniref:NADH-ubiquinone oxidoreductase chain 1 n=1 Tax=Ascidiella aspersa TaxID=201961 RepID=S0DFG0_9ASCI|nr:NADH dehydrogenase subunit 1 [Ascidiella aspersa]CCO25816.1 NADH dehydrogenase subunit 1 [Ascidiella aspersa]